MGYAHHRFALRLDDEEKSYFDRAAAECNAEGFFYGKLTATRVFIWALKRVVKDIEERRRQREADRQAAEQARPAERFGTAKAASSSASDKPPATTRPARSKKGAKAK